MPRIARRVRVTGTVQGVLFRAWTQEQARSLGVTGWVRNASDGSVKAHVEGDDEAVGQLIDRMHDGPTGATVEDVEVKESVVERLERFEVRH
ncbi:MAG TPA: acylphosphatase [Sphingomicrobium sp.]|nr:acylphosphatase [Sphingomicrobium sp.]